MPLRDHTGTAQLVVLKDPALRSAISALRQETVVQILGTVQRRPQGNTNVRMATGGVEVHLESLQVLNQADALPFSVSDRASSVNTQESLRLAHRYLDLRGSKVMDNLKLRSAVSMAMRKFLVEKHSEWFPGIVHGSLSPDLAFLLASLCVCVCVCVCGECRLPGGRDPDLVQAHPRGSQGVPGTDEDGWEVLLFSTEPTAGEVAICSVCVC